MSELPPNLEDWKKAGKIAGKSLAYATERLVVGASLREVCDKVEEYVIKQGAGIAFPCQISLNDLAAHYCPAHEENTVLQKEDVAKIDVGVEFNGCIGDTACSVYHGTDETKKQLILASKNALEAAIQTAQPGVTVAEVGAAIEREITLLGFNPVRNLSGHGLGQFKIHTAPNIPNFNNKSSVLLQKGQVIAIEPFATNGAGMIHDTGKAEVYMLIEKKPVRDLITRNVLNEIIKYKGLPFAGRWLCRTNSPVKVGFALRELQRLGSVRAYAPLGEVQKGIVAQTEHSIIVDEEPIVTTRI